MKRGPTCSVCVHPRRVEIDADGRAAARVAQAFGCAASSLHRHRHHKKKAPKKFTPPPEPSQDTNERDALLAALGRLRAALARAEAEQLPRIANAITAASKRLQAIAEEAEISEADIVGSRCWRAILARLEAALRPYPDAARAMLDALEEPV